MNEEEIKMIDKFDKIIEKYFGKEFPIELKAILILIYTFSDKKSEENFEKQVILLKQVIEKSKKKGSDNNE